MRIFKAIFITGFIVLILLSSTGMVIAQDEESFIREKQISKTDAFVLSVVFPGLGQMTRGEKVKGVSMFVAETISLVFAITAHEDYNTKYNVYKNDLKYYESISKKGSYENALELYDDLKDSSEKLDNLNTIRNAALITAGVVYAYNIFDAIMFSKGNDVNTVDSRDNKIRVQSAFIDHTPGILLSKSF